MNDLSNKHFSTQPATIFLDCLPCGLTDETAVADALWEKIGLNVDPSMISVKTNERGQCNAVVIIDRYSAADFIERCLRAAGETIVQVKPAMTRSEKKKRGLRSDGKPFQSHVIVSGSSR